MQNIFSSLKDEDLEYAYRNQVKLGFSDEQKKALQAEVSNRANVQKTMEVNTKQPSKGKVMVKTMLKKQYNGFTSYLTLGLILVGYATGFLAYISYICNH